MFHVEIPDYVKVVLDRLTARGHSAYIVGGSLRDLMLGHTPHDWDVTTSAHPDETLAAFGDMPTIPTGLKHGTVTVLSEHNPIEVTTYRIDGSYTDARRPDSVTFTDRIADDLARRDFTVNAMAYSPTAGPVDLYGGRDDLAAGILRAVGDPPRRFTEDALRILRGFRFSAQLNFTIEPATLAAMAETREGLAKISAERILSELSRLLTAPAAARGWSALCEAGVLPYVLPRRATSTYPLIIPDTLPASLPTRLAYVLFGMNREDIRADLNGLKPSTALKEAVMRLTEQTTPPTDISAPAVRRLCRHYGDLIGEMLSLWESVGHDVTELRNVVITVLQEGFCRTLADLAIDGDTLCREAGIPRGRELGHMLNALLEAVTDHPEDNDRERLIALARQLSHPKEDTP